MCTCVGEEQWDTGYGQNGQASRSQEAPIEAAYNPHKTENSQEGWHFDGKLREYVAIQPFVHMQSLEKDRKLRKAQRQRSRALGGKSAFKKDPGIPNLFPFKEKLMRKVTP